TFVITQDFEQAPALVGNDLKLLDLDTYDELLHRLPPLAMSSLARDRDSNVPASVHQPWRMSNLSSPRAMYALFTSEISSSPRPEGLRPRTMSNTRSSYM